MIANPILKAMPIVCAGLLCAACSDHSTSPPGAADITRTGASNAHQAVVNIATLPEPFTARASLAPYFINQNPDLMLRSQVTADMAIQRLVTASGGGGGWHTHPGPSFAIVDAGAVRITRYDTKTGCTSTAYGPNEAAGRTYYEVAGEIHKATVVSADPAVEYKVRLNVPAGAPFSNPVATDPVC